VATKWVGTRQQQKGYYVRILCESRFIRPAHGPARSRAASFAPRRAHPTLTKELVINVTAFAKWTGILLLLLTLGTCGGDGDDHGGTGTQRAGTVAVASDFLVSFEGAEKPAMLPDAKLVIGAFARNSTRTGYGLARILP
jgi:hypothetical protein